MKSLSLTQPHAIVMVGIPGSGKSFFAEKFADTFNAPYISYDLFRPLISDHTVLAKLIAHQLRELLKTNHSLIIEGFAYSRAERTELAKLFKNHGYETLFVWVQTDNNTSQRRSRKQLKIPEEDYDKLMKRFSPPHPNEKPVVISGKHTYASQAKTVLKRLSAPRAEISAHSAPPMRSLSDVKRAR